MQYITTENTMIFCKSDVFRIIYITFAMWFIRSVTLVNYVVYKS